ncbi:MULTISPECIES: FecR family protein [unclassified Sphingobacterium]|uniref:FecR family protein n=1 Tax=unclassified Sphingobacterium TaxID=2609468 RepID=UPI0025D75CE4|nr:MULTISPECIES: FecR domain-containing protein [unclassified Sphingobacterium]
MEKETLRYTLRQYIHGKLSEENSRKFLSYIKSGKDKILLQEIIQEVLDDPIDQYLLDDPAILAVLDNTWDQLHLQINKPKTRSLWDWKRIGAIAASIIGLLAIGQRFFNVETNNVGPPAIQSAISPGKQSATLLLANGKQIYLYDTQDGQIVEESGINIAKTSDGQLIYEVVQHAQGALGQNTLSTTKGQTYRIKLPDGTQVWLNAASSLRYPVRFSKGGNRTVVLTGEAYFEVAKDSKHPFIVKTANQEVKVLGTHFNLSSYAEESTQTTLLEGRVQVSSRSESVLLVPGEQSNLSANGVLKSRQVDTAPIIAWTNNEFMFDGDDIECVMRKIARWYNVDVIFQGRKTTEKFGGGISRFDDVQKVLGLLEKTGAVHFRIDGKTLYVLP